MGSDDDFPIRQGLPVELGFGAGLAGLGFPEKRSYIIVHLYEFYPFIGLQRGGHGWIGCNFRPHYLI